MNSKTVYNIVTDLKQSKQLIHAFLYACKNHHIAIIQFAKKPHEAWVTSYKKC